MSPELNAFQNQWDKQKLWPGRNKMARQKWLLRSVSVRWFFSSSASYHPPQGFRVLLLGLGNRPVLGENNKQKHMAYFQMSHCVSLKMKITKHRKAGEWEGLKQHWIYNTRTHEVWKPGTICKGSMSKWGGHKQTSIRPGTVRAGHGKATIDDWFPLALS